MGMLLFGSNTKKDIEIGIRLSNGFSEDEFACINH